MMRIMMQNNLLVYGFGKNLNDGAKTCNRKSTPSSENKNLFVKKTFLKIARILQNHFTPRWICKYAKM